ncbi:hypothetical protein ISG33_06090 [Glaciecola sp. MH2013]|uniref:hypothetical protein n=1 Tax=Glaciecola sp. MH2013 TaxID=2785524 RepID=UPI00189EBC4E|nr:hypothetical protein [Glaciecola sp. MH2013]MBF7072967.1 hypothetical protein [Glaciecola sp. MH2013]
MRVNANIFAKRSLMASVFLCLLACSPSEKSTVSDNTDVQALLSLSELLSASDLQEGIKQAYTQNDRDLYLYWQEQALLVAVEARLSQKDIALLSSEQGLRFLEYQAKKLIFNEEFVKRLLEFESLDTLINQFPHLEALHNKAEMLVEQRDALVSKAMIVLQEDGFEGDVQAEARRQWRDFMINSGKVELILGYSMPLPVSE